MKENKIEKEKLKIILDYLQFEGLKRANLKVNGKNYIYENGVLEESQLNKRYRFTADLSKVTKSLKKKLRILGVIYALLFVLHLIASEQTKKYYFLEHFLSSTVFSLSSILWWISVLVGVITLVSFFVWIYRANLNCHGFGAKGMKFTPGWAVGYFFIPFLNLVRPYQIMKEIWKISTDPKNWKKIPTSGLLRWWWGVILTRVFFGFVVEIKTGSVKTALDMKSVLRLSALEDLLSLMIVILTMRLVTAIFSRQERLIKRRGRTEAGI